MFDWNRWRKRWGKRSRRIKASHWPLACSAVLLVALLETGCHRPDWKERFTSAETEFRNGNSGAALVLVGDLPASPDANSSIWYWRARVLKAQLFRRQGQPAQTLDFLSQFPTTLPDEIAAKKEILFAETLCSIGKIEEAAQHLNTAERFIPAADPLLQAQLFYGRGDCASYNHPDAAMRMFEQAVTLAHSRDSYMEASSLAYQGYLMMQENYYDKAIELFERASTLTDAPYLKQSLLGNQGYATGQLGEWIASGSYLRQAIKIASHVEDAKANHALWINDLGRQQLTQMEYDDAQQSFREGFSAAKEANMPDLSGLCMINSAVTAMYQGNLVLAKQQIAAAEQVKNLGEWQPFLILAKARLLRLEDNPHASELLLNDVLAAKPNDHLTWLAESGLAETFVVEKRPADADRMFQRAIATFERGFERISSERFRISFLDQDPFYDAYISFLFSQDRGLDALNVSERGRSRTLAEGHEQRQLGSPLDLRGIQRNLARQGHEIVLAYWLTPKQSYLWLISANEVKTFTLAPEKDIVREVEAYDRATLDQADSESPYGKTLFKMLVAPAQRFIPKDARVIIVPHRRLGKLNFETLVTDGEKPHFWIEDVTIQNISFLAAVENPERAKPAYAKQMLLMGNPVQASKEFPGLVYAPQEVSAVAGRFKQFDEGIYTQANATPEAYEASKPAQFRFLHFVTHGTASDQNPLESAIILSPGKDGFKLYARDIIKTTIHPELVTISSCYGAGTRQYSGEGLVGLSWAFLRAGAHNVIGALWETDDEASVKLMETFYTEMGKRDDPASALRTAKLSLLHSNSFWQRPYYWGALQLYSSN